MSTIPKTYMIAILADAAYALGAAVQGDLAGATRFRFTDYLCIRKIPRSGALQ
jgi:hypothetical protein